MKDFFFSTCPTINLRPTRVWLPKVMTQKLEKIQNDD